MDCECSHSVGGQTQTLIHTVLSYFRMTSTANGASGAGTVINYSSRFTVTGMTGVTPPNIAAAVPGGTAGPPTQNNVVAGGQADPAAGADAAPDAGAYTVPYDKQTGTVRYAPMQPIPPTKITKKGKPTPLFSASAFDIATARMPNPTVLSTVTQSQTVHGMTMENTVSTPSSPLVHYRWATLAKPHGGEKHTLIPF